MSMTSSCIILWFRSMILKVHPFSVNSPVLLSSGSTCKYLFSGLPFLNSFTLNTIRGVHFTRYPLTSYVVTISTLLGSSLPNVGIFSGNKFCSADWVICFKISSSLVMRNEKGRVPMLRWGWTAHGYRWYTKNCLFWKGVISLDKCFIYLLNALYSFLLCVPFSCCQQLLQPAS